MKYTFSCRDDYGQETFMALDTDEVAHNAVTRFYCQFLRACGFIINYGDNDDINYLFDLEVEEEFEDEDEEE